MAKRRRTNGEGAVYQTKDGRWRGSVELGWERGTRQRKYLSRPTKAAVNRAMREALAQVESGVPLTRDGAGPTVEEWLWYWHDTIQARRVREATLSAQEVVIRRHLVPHIGRVRLRELTPEHVESMLVRLEGPGFNSTSVLKVHRCLSRSLVVAMQRGLVARNVCTLIDAPTPRCTRSSHSPVRRRGACSPQPVAGRTRRGGSLRWRPACGRAKRLRSPGRTSTSTPGRWRSGRHVAGRYAHGCGRPPTCGKRPVDCPQQKGHGPELADVKSRAGKRVLTLPQPLVEALRAHRTAQLELLADDEHLQPRHPGAQQRGGPAHGRSIVGRRGTAAVRLDPPAATVSCGCHSAASLAARSACLRRPQCARAVNPQVRG
jgi:hypothetical protein